MKQKTAKGRDRSGSNRFGSAGQNGLSQNRTQTLQPVPLASLRTQRAVRDWVKWLFWLVFLLVWIHLPPHARAQMHEILKLVAALSCSQ